MVETAYDVAALRERLNSVRKRIEKAAQGCNRASEEITLIAVTKTHPSAMIRDAASLGLTDFGENRVQEAESKIPEIGLEGVRWHLIGHLQANKARRAVKLFDIIHTIDSISLAKRVERLCAEESIEKLRVFIQVDLGWEETKSGISENDLDDLAVVVEECARLELVGLMTLPPFFEDPELVRPFFSKLRELRNQLIARGHFAGSRGELSMGMSHDFEVAIEEGATMIRVGTAIFGERTT